VVRPIDMNQGVTQSYATEKIQKVQQEHPDMQQRYFSLQLQEEKKRQNEKILDAEEAKNKIIDAQQEKNRERDEKGSKNKQKHIADDHDADSNNIPEQEAHHIDIKA
jgi:hypothetical protein